MLGLFRKKKKQGFKGRDIIKEMPRGIRINFIDAVLEQKGFSELRKIKRKRYNKRADIIGCELLWHESENGKEYWENIWLDLKTKNRF